ncbi:MAG: hypothetical protein IPK97_18425 [Ahniella sp.]|nr:hypothetical protein [Ahniella sp.]
MAHRFSAFAVPAEHIKYLQQHPGAVFHYLEGREPESIDPSSLPAGWPTERLKSLGAWGINHRNVDLYHWILNGGPTLVTGSGSIFQTWYQPDRHSAIKLDMLNERFAFSPEQIQELTALVAQVTVQSVVKAFAAWSKSQGNNHELDEEECEPFVEEFDMFGTGLNEALNKGYGLIW